HHNFERHLLALALHLTGSLENRAALHARDFRKEQAQTTATKTKHGIRFANLVHVMQELALLVDMVKELIHVGERLRLAQSHLQFRELAEQLIDVRQKFVERRIEQANRHRKAGHLAKDANEVAALQRQKFLQRFLARADAVRQNHFAHRR